MTRLFRLIAEFYSTSWAIKPETLAAMSEVLSRAAAGVRLSAEEIRAAVGDAPEARAARRGVEQRSGGSNIAVLPVFGIIGHRAGLVYDTSSGVGTSTELVGQAFDAVLNDPAVGAIVLDVESPGGSAAGVQELSDKIYGARGTKPIVAVANAEAASAAYWIASAADELVVTPSGQVGSIGVWTAHDDISKAMAAKGVERTLISAGKYKVEGHPWGPLDAEGRAAIQRTVDTYYGMFVKAVARNRNDTQTAVRDGYGEGRMLVAADAVKAKLADRVGTFEQVIGELQQKLASPASTSTPKRAAAERALRLAEAS